MDECDILARYLIGRPATPGLRSSYHRALKNIPVHFTEEQQQVWNHCMKRAWMLPHVDAYLGFRHPDHPIRKKIFIMLCMLETQPDYSDLFLPSRGKFCQLVAVMATGISALARIFTGRIIIWML